MALVLSVPFGFSLWAKLERIRTGRKDVNDAYGDRRPDLVRTSNAALPAERKTPEIQEQISPSLNDWDYLYSLIVLVVVDEHITIGAYGMGPFEQFVPDLATRGDRVEQLAGLWPCVAP